MTKKKITVNKFEESQPCGNCPYRRDAKLQYWSVSEFAKLTDADRDRIGKVFSCHKNDGQVCRGWLMDQKKRDYPSLALRISLSKQNVSPQYLEGLNSPSPLYYSISEMCIANYPTRFTLVPTCSTLQWINTAIAKPENNALVLVTQHPGNTIISEREYQDTTFLARYNQDTNTYLADNGPCINPSILPGITFWATIPEITSPHWIMLRKQKPVDEYHMIIATTMKKGRKASLQDKHPPVRLGHYSIKRKQILAMSGPAHILNRQHYPHVTAYMFLPDQPVKHIRG